MATADKPTLSFYDINGDAGQVVRQWEWKLQGDYGLTKGYNSDWYALRKRKDGWYIIAKPGCMWDYASGWFDHDGIKEASLGHDILHWLIAKGVIDPIYNDLIDREFYLILRERGNLPSWRASILMKATNLCDQKVTGVDRHVIHLLKGKRIKINL